MSKKIIYVIIIVVTLGIIVYYQLFKKGNNAKSGLQNSDSLNENKDSTNNNTGNNTGNDTGIGVGNSAVINIANTSLTASPLIGQLHLKATVNVTNQPNTGTLIVQIGNVFLSEVALPLLNGNYVLDEYLALPQQSVYNLTAKIGSVSKTVQVNAPN